METKDLFRILEEEGIAFKRKIVPSDILRDREFAEVKCVNARLNLWGGAFESEEDLRKFTAIIKKIKWVEVKEPLDVID